MTGRRKSGRMPSLSGINPVTSKRTLHRRSDHLPEDTASTATTAAADDDEDPHVLGDLSAKTRKKQWLLWHWQWMKIKMGRKHKIDRWRGGASSTYSRGDEDSEASVQTGRTYDADGKAHFCPNAWNDYKRRMDQLKDDDHFMHYLTDHLQHDRANNHNSVLGGGGSAPTDSTATKSTKSWKSAATTTGESSSSESVSGGSSFEKKSNQADYGTTMPPRQPRRKTTVRKKRDAASAASTTTSDHKKKQAEVSVNAPQQLAVNKLYPLAFIRLLEAHAKQAGESEALTRETERQVDDNNTTQQHQHCSQDNTEYVDIEFEEDDDGGEQQEEVEEEEDAGAGNAQQQQQQQVMRGEKVGRLSSSMYNNNHVKKAEDLYQGDQQQCDMRRKSYGFGARRSGGFGMRASGDLGQLGGWRGGDRGRGRKDKDKKEDAANQDGRRQHRQGRPKLPRSSTCQFVPIW